MRPITGTSTVFLTLMRRIIAIKIRLAAKQKTSANTIRAAVPMPGAMVSATRMPSLAASRPPVVAGSTNLLRTICWRITPHTAKPTPVSTNAASRGNRLAVSVSQASSDDNSCSQETCFTPTSTEARHSRANSASQRMRINGIPDLSFSFELSEPHASPWQTGAVPETARNAPGWRAVPRGSPVH